MRHHPKRRLNDVGTATLALGMLFLPWAVPHTVTSLAGVPTSTVSRGQTESLPAEQGKKITLDAPAGWQRSPRTTKNTVTYTEGQRTLTVTVLTGAKDQRTAFDRHVRASSLKGTLFQLEGQKFTTKNGFDGIHCSVSTRGTNQRGNCAMSTKGEALVVVSSLSERGSEPFDINPLLVSLAVKDPK
ncbi:hypothetical protein SAMN05421595_0061 [Austwickia chelonae]|uniref:Uncharacterized protein n=1 Tax=Austwickia chelonae NBRC 105200 TaxID=1184607 RepID=K6VU31_9MICO|nr:hypothetical protein [Austwickia chelonae]GAB78850.1 hypothetical protein AUCHE_17_00620 [Austwickia chelonae NBRC 105200]SEV85287.1 hypothetical protein SAMN05421595_0061 [Austwickia chelonae]